MTDASGSQQVGGQDRLGMGSCLSTVGPLAVLSGEPAMRTQVSGTALKSRNALTWEKCMSCHGFIERSGASWATYQ